MAKKAGPFENIKNFFKKDTTKIAGLQLSELIMVSLAVIFGLLSVIGFVVWANNLYDILYLIFTILFLILKELNLGEQLWMSMWMNLETWGFLIKPQIFS